MLFFFRVPTGYAISDSNSTNGTFINGTKLQSGDVRILEEGDEVKIGDVRLIYSFSKKK